MWARRHCCCQNAPELSGARIAQHMRAQPAKHRASMRHLRTLREQHAPSCTGHTSIDVLCCSQNEARERALESKFRHVCRYRYIYECNYLITQLLWSEPSRKKVLKKRRGAFPEPRSWSMVSVGTRSGRPNARPSRPLCALVEIHTQAVEPPSTRYSP